VLAATVLKGIACRTLIGFVWLVLAVLFVKNGLVAGVETLG
jgi:hypothetical protein